MDIRNQWTSSFILTVIVFSLAIAGCRRDDDQDESSSSNTVGTNKCMQCHYDWVSNAYDGGTTDSIPTSPTYYDLYARDKIGENYQRSIHFTPGIAPTAKDYVTCEGCHGAGGNHNGFGPIPFYAPGVEQCGGCHKSPAFDLTAFKATTHANPQPGTTGPDTYFSCGGVGSDPAVVPSNSGPRTYYKTDSITPVSKNEHIEECSVCHAPLTRRSHIITGDISTPQVACASCHDPHMPAGSTRNYVTTRPGGPVDAAFVPNFKPLKVNNVFSTTDATFGAKNPLTGTWIRPRMSYPYYVNNDPNTTYSGYANQVTQGDWLRLSPERLCAGCHAKVTFMYSAFRSTNGATPTAYANPHGGSSIFNQYLNSGHADKEASAFKEFSLLWPTDGTGDRPTYPGDMGVNTNPATPGQASNYTCNQCHHGIATIDYQKGVQGSRTLGDWQTVGDAHILWGDATVTCITCHEVHGTHTELAIRVPKYLSYNTGFKPANSPNGTGNLRGGSNTMLDLTAIPTGTGSSIICLFCHQGRESGWTVWNKFRQKQADPNDLNWAYANPTTAIVAGNVANPHYFGGGAFLWSKNCFEFIGTNLPNGYSNGIPAHQTTNCTGCHMGSYDATNKEGGHTWKACKTDPAKVTCVSCHGTGATFTNIIAKADYDANGILDTTTIEIGTLVNIADNQSDVWNTAPVAGWGSGLIGLLNRALYDSGIKPVLNSSGTSVSFQITTGSTSASTYSFYQYGAMFNLSHAIRAQDATHVHNPRYTVQLLIDSLLALGKTTYPGSTRAFLTNRPANDRIATDYRILNPSNN